MYRRWCGDEMVGLTCLGLGFVWFAHSYLSHQGCCTDMANGLVEFGAAFTLLGKSENGAIALAMANLGRTADSLAVVAKKHVSGSGSGTRPQVGSDSHCTAQFNVDRLRTKQYSLTIPSRTTFASLEQSRYRHQPKATTRTVPMLAHTHIPTRCCLLCLAYLCRQH